MFYIIILWFSIQSSPSCPLNFTSFVWLRIQTASLNWLMMLPFFLMDRFSHHIFFPFAVFLFRKLNHLSCRSYTVWVLLIVFLGYYYTSSSGLCVSCKLVVLEVWADSRLILCQEYIMGDAVAFHQKTRNVSWSVPLRSEQPVIIIVQIHTFC